MLSDIVAPIETELSSAHQGLEDGSTAEILLKGHKASVVQDE